MGHPTGFARLALLALLLGACARTPEVDPLASDLARERASAHFEHGDLGAARAALAPLLAVDEPELADLERAAAIDYRDREVVAFEPALARLAARDPGNAPLHYMRARLALEQGDFAGAERHFRAVLERAPDDPATLVGLASTLLDLDQVEAGRELLGQVAALGIEHAGSWYVQAIYRLSQLARAGAGAQAEARAWLDHFAQLQALGYRAASAPELDLGTLVRVAPPRPRPPEGALVTPAPTFGAPRTVLPELSDAQELQAVDLDQDGDTDLLAAGAFGVRAGLAEGEAWNAREIASGPVELVRTLDLGNDDETDLLLVRGNELVLLEQRSGAELLLEPEGARWRPSPLVFAPCPAPIRDLVPVDFDHDGDLDLALAGDFGARLLRNDGAAPRTAADGTPTRGAFADVTTTTGLVVGKALSWLVSEDFDDDQDVDLLLGGADTLQLASSLRGGRFEDVTTRVFPPELRLARAPLVADLDADGRVDLLARGAPAHLWHQESDGRFVARESSVSASPEGTLLALDLDLDGTLDVAWPGRTSVLEARLAHGLGVERTFTLAGRARPDAPLVALDLGRDLDLDLARPCESGIELFACEGPVGAAARLDPRGLKDNRRAIGAKVEVRTGGLYRRIYWRGEPVLAGCGPSPALDVLRITWPNGAIDTRLAVPPGDQPFVDARLGPLVQSDALIGSCPFLYAWNGARFVFVTDVLGGTPLGLPLGPGQLVPPDHDEFVLVRGDQLAPRDGKLVLQVTEELREVTYLDRARLDVIDHPAEVEIQPNERFSFPPFPEPHVHTLRAPLAPLSALGSDGRDWSAELARVDDEHATPFVPLEPQFLGLATPHWLELAFDPAAVRDAARLRLVATGWFFWSDASVNMAAARTPGVEFVPPVLQLCDAQGEWHDAGPPLGFPAGKSKTMVIELGPEVTAALEREPRLRLRSTLRLHWDALRLAVDADDAPLVVTPLEPGSAELWRRGFSQPLTVERGDLPERFDWEELAPAPRWDPHPGLYTRYGESGPLVVAIDDQFVILGSGDALRLEFDARALPPLPTGWTRDYLLFLDGWAKDRDPNTLEALTVEPLPFHGMSGYPYGPDEHFPDSPAHDAWRRTWNTRRAQPWIVPLAPARETEHARELARAAR